ncbi:MAG: SGNH/GDSL hydrolase family protein [Mesorhizobium sp.]|nr:SGNH/GDSL hydrolase family protein [Mesorhizobium sp.]MBL8577121.1 SGNH/GDSL hydrolase family protein [Mesorhizobium sp.]
MTKTILCYGDSLTWGYNAEGPSRHAYEDRWPSVLQAELGSGVRIIADGLNGRTTAFDDHLTAADRNGARTLGTALLTHAPLDLVIVMLGANDMKPQIHGSPAVAKYGMLRLVEIIRGTDYGFGWKAPGILLVSPPAVSRTDDAEFSQFFAGGQEASRQLARYYAELAETTGTGFFDAGSVAETTPLDGVHLDAENTRAVGRGLVPVVRKMLEL